MREAVIVSGVRTAVGNFGGTIAGIPAPQLGALVVNQAMKKAGLKPKTSEELLSQCPEKLKTSGLIDLEKKYYDFDDSLQPVNVDEVIMGEVIMSGQGQNPSRQVCIYGGIPKETTTYTLNKLCASGMKTIALAAQSIMMGEDDVVIAGGMENMSSIPYHLPKARWGARMFNAELVDALVYDGLWEGFYNYHMGNTAENIAEKYAISREDQDKLSLMSNQRALAAIKNGIFKDEIVPVPVKVRKEIKQFDTDEHPRDTSLEALGKLPTVFKKDGTITAGNASAISDAAAACVVMSAEKAKELGLKPMATIRAWAAGGVDPAYMGLGAVTAMKRALKNAGLGLKDINYIELNEAFAAQAIGVMEEMNINPEDINLYGSGISIGHPIGCTGTRITVTLLHEMVRKNLQFGMSALCVGGGMGMAIILERK